MTNFIHHQQEHCSTPTYSWSISDQSVCELMPFTAPLVQSQQSLIPGIDQLFQPQKLAEQIFMLTTSTAREITLQPIRVQLIPGDSCLVSYQGRFDGQPFHCYARAFAHKNRHMLGRVLQRDFIDSLIGQSVIIDRSNALVISFYPNDLELPGLHRLLANNPYVYKLSYQPEQGFTGLMDGDRQKKVVKLYRQQDYAQAQSLAMISKEIPSMPNPLSYHEDLHGISLQWCDGQTLSELLGSTDACDIAYQTGITLARLHNHSIPQGLTVKDGAYHQSRLAQIITEMNSIIPHLSSRMISAGNRLSRLLTLHPSEMCLAHGNLTVEKILSGREGIQFADCDYLSQSPAMADLGQLIASLNYAQSNEQINPEITRKLIDSLSKGYRSQRDLPGLALNAYTALAMMQRLGDPLKNISANWPVKTEQWLNQIEQLLTQTSPSHPHTPEQITHARQPSISRLNQLLDSEKVSKIIQTILQKENRIPLSGPIFKSQIQRLKPGHSALIKYTLCDCYSRHRIEAFGKIYSQGLDRKKVEIHRQVFKQLKHRSDNPALRIPKPIAIVESLGLWLQQHVDGIDGWQALDDNAIETAQLMAKALSQFHQLDFIPCDQHSWLDEIQGLEFALDQLKQELPELTDRLDNLYEQCLQLIRQLEGRRQTLIHRNLSPQKFIVNQQQLYLLNLDQACIGDPAFDLGKLIAHIQEHDLRHCGNPNHRDYLTAIIMHHYQQNNQDQDLQKAIDIYRLLTLARHIGYSIHCADRREFTLQILNFTENELEKAHSLYLSTPHGGNLNDC